MKSAKGSSGLEDNPVRHESMCPQLTSTCTKLFQSQRTLNGEMVLSVLSALYDFSCAKEFSRVLDKGCHQWLLRRFLPYALQLRKGLAAQGDKFRLHARLRKALRGYCYAHAL
jgi:hypothetical protein